MFNHITFWLSAILVFVWFVFRVCDEPLPPVDKRKLPEDWKDEFKPGPLESGYINRRK